MTLESTRPGLWGYVFKLLKLQWVIFYSGFRRANLRRKFGVIVLALLAVGALVGSFFLTRWLVSLLNSPTMAEFGVDLSPLMDSVPVLVVSAAFFGILVTSFGLLLQALYLSNDMDFLLTAPIPIRAVFLSKLLQAILPNFLLILLAGLPLLYGLAAAGGYNLLYYPMVLVVIAFLALAAAGLSSLLVMAVVRVFPARRVAEVLGVVSALVIMISAQWRNLMGGSESDALTPEQVAAGTQFVSRFNTPWSPLAWGGRGLVDLGEGRWLSGLLLIAVALGLAGAIFWFALSASERLYYTGWASLQTGGGRKKIRNETGRLARSERTVFPLSLLPSQVRAIVSKDSIEMRRNLRNLSQLASPLIMGVVFGAMLLRSGGIPPEGRGEAPAAFMEAFRTFLLYGGMAVSLFVGWSLVTNLALISFSMEHKSYWILKTAPVSGGRLLMSKFLLAFIPGLVLSWLFLLVLALVQKIPLLMLLYSLPAEALILAGLAGIQLAFGVRSANFDWTDPRHMGGGGAGCLALIIGGIYLVVAAALFFGPPIAAPMLGLAEWIGQLVGLLLGGAFTLACTFLPTRSVLPHVARLAEGI